MPSGAAWVVSFLPRGYKHRRDREWHGNVNGGLHRGKSKWHQFYVKGIYFHVVFNLALVKGIYFTQLNIWRLLGGFSTWLWYRGSTFTQLNIRSPVVVVRPFFWMSRFGQQPWHCGKGWFDQFVSHGVGPLLASQPINKGSHAPCWTEVVRTSCSGISVSTCPKQ